MYAIDPFSDRLTHAPQLKKNPTSHALQCRVEEAHGRRGSRREFLHRALFWRHTVASHDYKQDLTMAREKEKRKETRREETSSSKEEKWEDNSGRSRHANHGSVATKSGVFIRASAAPGYRSGAQWS